LRLSIIHHPRDLVIRAIVDDGLLLAYDFDTALFELTRS
jgi:hypothetical protein